MKQLIRVTVALAALGLVALPAGLWAQTTGAQLVGNATDESGGALPGVTVTAGNAETGLERAAVTGAEGSYRFPTLPPGSYQVTAALEGFTTVQVNDVVLNVGVTRDLDFTLKIAAVEEVITVADTAPLVRTDASGGTVISQQELETLPLNGRQFASLGTLAAGTTLSFNTDPTKPGQQTIALNGGIGRNVNYVVDGGDNMDDTIGGALQNLSIEGVQEFSLLTQTYKAEYGRSTGGVLSVVTKSGTNEFDGSVFYFRRDDELNSQTESEKRAGIDKQPFEREQYGGSVGGPIVKDRAHFFVTYEETERAGSVAVNSGGIFPNLDGTLTGTPFTDELLTGKITFDVSAKQFLQVRYAEQENADKYGAVPTATPDNFGTLTNTADTLLLGHTAQIGATSFNEIIIQDSEFQNLITADSNNPTSVFPSGVTSGQNTNTPQGTFQDKLQIRDDFSFTKTLGGDVHDFKVGLEYVDEPDLGGDFPSGLNGIFTRSEDRADSPVTDITFFGGSFSFSTPNTQYRLYAQDDWQVNDRLTVNLGLRYEYTDVLELDQRSNVIWQTLSSLPDSFYQETPYLEGFRNGGGGMIEADDDDLAPRLGFSYDLKGDGQQIVRGGFGIYYDFPYTNATVLFPSAAVLSQFGVVFNNNDPAGIRNGDGSFFLPGDPLPPNQLPPDQTALAPAPNEIASPTLATPKSTMLSLGYSHQLTPSIGLNVDVVSIQYRDIPFRVRVNPRVDTTGDGVPDQRRFPDFGSFRLWLGDGEADYDALNVTLRGRASDKFEFQAFYTLSKAEGNILAGADEFRLTNTGHQPELGGTAADASFDAFDPACDRCFGPLNTDARHRVTLSGIYHGPYGILFSGIVRYRSALPYTLHLGTDANGDGFNRDLAPGVSANSERGSSFSQVDLRISKIFSIWQDLSIEIIGEVFNLFNDENPAGFVGSLAASNFGEPTTFAGDQLQGEQRLAQLGVRVRF
jgi:hypothetical protein